MHDLHYVLEMFVRSLCDPESHNYTQTTEYETLLTQSKIKHKNFNLSHHGQSDRMLFYIFEFIR